MAVTSVTFCAYDSPTTLGGPVAWILRLFPALRASGIEPRCLFLTWGEDGPAVTALREQGFDCPSTNFQTDTRGNIRWILERLQERPPDVFVPNLVPAAYFAARWVRSRGIPTIGILHSDDAFYRGLQDSFVFGRRAFRISSIVCVSSELERQVRDRRPRDTEIHRIPYGVPVPASSCQRTSSMLRLAYVGRLAEEQKRISDVTRALCRTVQRVPDTEAILFGDGPDRSAVEQILREGDQGEGVVLAGRVDSHAIQRRLLESHVVALLSDYEGLPIAILEAMACVCVPVCLKMRSGIPVLGDNGVTGLVVDDRGDGFVEAVRRLHSEPGLWERLSRAARERVESGYSMQSCAAQWAELLACSREKSKPKRGVLVPSPLRLPPTHPGFAHQDRRAPSGLSVRITRFRIRAGAVRRRLFGPRPSRECSHSR